MEEQFTFSEICKDYGIKVFTGIVAEQCPSDIMLTDAANFLEYCRINDIKSIILTFTFNDVEELNVEEIKHKLRRFFDNKLEEYPYSELFFPKYITKDFYLPAWLETMKLFEKEGFHHQGTVDEDPIAVEAWAIHSGCRISAVVYEKEEGQAGASLSAEEVLNKYARIIKEKLQIFRAKAEAESQRLIQEHQSVIIAEIKEIIENKPDLVYCTTQKARNEFADRIQIIFQNEKGCDWLTKKQVRSLVEHHYIKLTE